VPGSRLEAAVSGLVARARLFERVTHDQHPWQAWIRGEYSVCLHLERHECSDRIVLVGYLHTPVKSVTSVEIWCGEDMLMCYPVAMPEAGPFRVAFALAIEDTELAA
jgi:hypothetical protein